MKDDIVAQERRNVLFDHPSSKAVRAEQRGEGPKDPHRDLRAAHRAELNEQGQEFRQEHQALMDKHNEARMNNPLIASGAQAPQQWQDREKEEHRELNARLDKKRAVLTARHRAQLEESIKRNPTK